MSELNFYKDIINPYFTLVTDNIEDNLDREYFNPYYISNFCLPGDMSIYIGNYDFSWMKYNSKVHLSLANNHHEASVEESLEELNKKIRFKYRKSFKILNVKRWIRLYDNLFDWQKTNDLFNYFPLHHWTKDPITPQLAIPIRGSAIHYNLGLYNSTLEKIIVARLYKNDNRNTCYNLDDKITHASFKLIYECEE